jgi:hypothetical protein
MSRALSSEPNTQENRFEIAKAPKEVHTRKQEKHQMAREHHTWKILLAKAKVDHQQLATLNRDITESEHRIAIEKAKKPPDG